MSVGRMPAFHRPYFPLLFKVHFAPTPYAYRSSTAGSRTSRRHASPARVAVSRLEQILRAARDQRIAAICIEPIVQGAAG